MKIGRLDTDERIVIVAEIGNNHEGSFALAEKIVGLAAEAGADAVKFQTIVPEKLVSPAQAQRIEQLRRFQLGDDQFEKLRETARRHGVVFLSTPFDVDSVRFLEPLVPAYKIASGDNNFLPLIGAIARTGKPVMMSCGLAGLEEIRRSRDFIRGIWKELGVDPGLALLHCVSSYPTEAADAHLGAIEELKHLGETVGYSDHTLGIEAAVLSVALGARIIEKHFTLNKRHSAFQDHQLSADPAEMSELVMRVREAEIMMGRGPRRLREAEQAVLTAARRSMVAARDLESGALLTAEDITWLRPGGGLEPGREGEVVGRTLTKSLPAGTMIRLEDLA